VTHQVALLASHYTTINNRQKTVLNAQIILGGLIACNVQIKSALNACLLTIIIRMIGYVRVVVNLLIVILATVRDA
jgi:hypothetical protein